MTHYTLKLSFDLRQVTQTLGHKFVLKNNSDYHQEVSGPLAGTFNFQQGDEVYVEIMATSAAHPNGQGATPNDILKTFAVNNCTLVSIPAHLSEFLSLFDTENACAVVEKWGPIENLSTPEDAQSNTLRLCTRSLVPLPVVTKNGQWKISGYLSASLTSAANQTNPRLFFFDPEGSSGNGGGWRP